MQFWFEDNFGRNCPKFLCDWLLLACCEVATVMVAEKAKARLVFVACQR